MITIKVDKKGLEQLENDFFDFIIERNIGYIIFVIKKEGTIITAFNNKKGDVFKVTIQGDNQNEIALKYTKNDILISKNKKNVMKVAKYLDIDAQIGSDEVGTGDFLGPIVVCAAFVDASMIPLLEEYGITDSKKFSDKKILETIPLLLKKVYYVVKVLPNEKFNTVFKKGFNMNKIKAVLHDYCLFKLSEKCPYVKSFYVDQFCSEEKYDEYLKGIRHLQNKIVFKEKGELYFPSVALASCIARYYFLEYMIKQAKLINKKIPLGAGNEVDEFSVYYIKKYGIEEFKKLCKQNFKNFEQIKKQLNL